MSDPVNLARLEEFSDGTPAGLAGLVQLFLDDSRDSLAQLVDAGRRGDRDALCLLAHRFGGTCAACGAERLARQLRELEEAAPQLSRGDGARLIERIGAAHREAALYLAGFLKGLQRS